MGDLGWKNKKSGHFFPSLCLMHLALAASASLPWLELGKTAPAVDLLPIEQLQLLDSGTSSLPCSPAQRVVLAYGVDNCELVYHPLVHFSALPCIKLLLFEIPRKVHVLLIGYY